MDGFLWLSKACISQFETEFLRGSNEVFVRFDKNGCAQLNRMGRVVEQIDSGGPTANVGGPFVNGDVEWNGEEVGKMPQIVCRRSTSRSGT